MFTITGFFNEPTPVLGTAKIANSGRIKRDIIFGFANQFRSLFYDGFEKTFLSILQRFIDSGFPIVHLGKSRTLMWGADGDESLHMMIFDMLGKIMSSGQSAHAISNENHFFGTCFLPHKCNALLQFFGPSFN